MLHAGANKIIVGGRNPKLQQQLVEKLQEEGIDTDQKIDASHTIDLGDLESVKEFAMYVRSTYPKIDVLIANAGIMNTPPGVTKNGFEQQMGVNVIGHFLLCKILVEQTKRQVWLASYAHSIHGASRIDIDYIKSFSMDNTADYDSWKAYQQSKLGNILIAREFQKRYAHLEAVALHPGSIATNLTRSTGLVSVVKLSWRMLPYFWKDMKQIGFKGLEAGAATTVTCATLPSDQLVPGGYYQNCEEGGEAENAKVEEDWKALFDFCNTATKDFQ